MPYKDLNKKREYNRRWSQNKRKCIQENISLKEQYKFPSIKLPDHIKPTKYPRYYVSNDGIAYREPRQIDVFGKYGKVNEYGLIQLTTHLRGNPNYGEEFMYESVNIYFYDETGKNIGSKKRNIHQLVAETWIPNPHGYNEILHGIKGNKCNHVDNLRWGTHAENMKESSNTLPEGAIRYHNRNATHYDGCKQSPTKYVKKDSKWVLIPSDKPVWNKGLRSGVADGTLKKCLNGYWKVKEDGKWNHLKQKDYAKYNIKTDI